MGEEIRLIYRLRERSAESAKTLQHGHHAFVAESTSLVREAFGPDGVARSAVEHLWLSNALVVTGDDDIHRAMGSLSTILRVHPDYEYDLIAPGFSSKTRMLELSEPETLWHHEWMQLRQLREEYGLTGEGSRVGILDTGIDASGRLAGRVAAFAYIGADGVIDEVAPPREPGQLTHGTHVAGIIAAERYGLAPAAKLYVASVNNGPMGRARWSQINKGLEWLINQQVHVINLSLGGPGHRDDLEDAFERCAAADIAVVAAVGNVSVGQSLYPGNSSRTFSAGAFGTGGTLIFQSGSEMPNPDVVAPGEEIYSTLRDGGAGAMTGTSQAAPQVTGLFALLRERSPTLSATVLTDIIARTALPLPAVSLVDQGRGSIQPLAAVRALDALDPSGALPMSVVEEAFDLVDRVEFVLASAQVEIHASDEFERTLVQLSDLKQPAPSSVAFSKQGNVLTIYGMPSFGASDIRLLIKTRSLTTVLGRLTSGSMDLVGGIREIQASAVSARIGIVSHPPSVPAQTRAFDLRNGSGSVELTLQGGFAGTLSHKTLSGACTLTAPGGADQILGGAGTTSFGDLPENIAIETLSGAIQINMIE